MKQKEELEPILITTKEKVQEEKVLNKLVEDFLKFDQIDKMYLYRLINKIEIDKYKNVYIYFNFSKISWQ